MIKSRKALYVSLLLACIILSIIIARFYGEHYHNKVQSQQKMYTYQTYWGAVNPVLYVEKEKYIDSLVLYYQKIENGDPNPTFNFPPLSLPYDTCVYVLEYLNDSSVAKVICYDDWGKKGWFVDGYVYVNTLHDLPPTDLKEQ